MAILKSVVQVNNGNTGWTKTNVLNALEETFTNLGFNGGSQVNGVVCSALPPGSEVPFSNSNYNSLWKNCGGGESGGNASHKVDRVFRYAVTASGSTYKMQQVIYSTNVNWNYTDTFLIGENTPLVTGDPIVFSSTTTININGGSLVDGTTYYAIMDSVRRIRLATTQANALAGTAIDITSSFSSGITVTFLVGSELQNPNLTIRQSDTVAFQMNAVS